MPQEAWSAKRERQYEHIKESAEEQGASTKRAKEIAARTVNKERARSGEARGVVATVPPRHVLESPRRPAVAYQSAEGPHQGAALQRGQEAGHRRALQDEQAAAPARSRPQEVARTGGVLHITNGDAAVPVLRAAGVAGTILPWRDVLHEGPVPAVDADELSAVRSRFPTERSDAFADRDRLLAEAEELVLWFEHDLYDQLQLAQVLAWSDAPASLVQAETYLAEADLPDPTRVSDRQRRRLGRSGPLSARLTPAGSKGSAATACPCFGLRSTACSRSIRRSTTASAGASSRRWKRLPAVRAIASTPSRRLRPRRKRGSWATRRSSRCSLASSRSSAATRTCG